MTNPIQDTPKKKVSLEAISLRKLRESSGIDRKQAGVILGVSPKTIEKFENGRSQLSPTKINQIISAYGYSEKDACDILAGKLDSILKQNQPQKPKVIGNNHMRRSYKRVVTKEVQTLITLRKLKSYSQYEASRKCGYCTSAIGHIENGRIELPSSRIEHIVRSYGFTMDEFNHHKNSEVFITEIQEECMKVIRCLSEEKLKAVYPLLKTFRN